MPDANKILESVLSGLSRAQEGNRNYELNKASYTVGGLVAAGHLDLEKARDLLGVGGLKLGLSETEVKSCILCGLAKGQKVPLVISNTARKVRRIANHGKTKDQEWKAILPAPDHAPDYRAVNHKELGKPSEYFEYRDENNLLLFVVVRWETPTGKEIRPLSYGAKEDRWCFKRPHHRVPMNLFGIVNRSDVKILICEGEKAACAAQELSGSMVVTCGMGGANQARVTDWSSLIGRKCLVLPDEDEASVTQWAPELADILFRQGTTVTILDPYRFWQLVEAYDDEQRCG